MQRLTAARALTMQRLIVRSCGAAKASARAVHTTPPTGSSSAERAVKDVEGVSMILNTSSTPKKGKVPDFIINHVAPIHSGSQWLQTKRQSEEEKFGEASLEGGYKQFREDIKGVVPDSRVFTDPLRTLAYGTDASFYRLVPKIVVKVHDEAEMIKLIQLAAKNKTPITFRAGGTSLSGQAITDSILLKLGHTWRYRKIEEDGKLITVEPGWILGQVNRMLAPYGRKLGPDPSSIDSCWIGGVVSNNSSGMCCGVLQNTYHTIKDLRLVMHDGAILDTADPASWASFQRTHKGIVDGVVALADKIRADEDLTALIKKKFSIKCTTGYSINALVDYTDPLEMIKHLFVGSEGTFGFVSRATYHSVPDYKDKASAFIMFPTVEDASNATWELRKAGCTDAVELFDRRSLRTCEDFEHLHFLRGASDTATALLIECRGDSAETLQKRIDRSIEVVKATSLTLNEAVFSYDASVSTAYWDARRALIPMVGAVREAGTSVLLEDVAVPVQNLAKLCNGVTEMFEKFEYHDGSAFGHALEGNLHLVFTQGFETPAEVARYEGMMDHLCTMVCELEGSLKAEHGTGRNVAPYVEMEWGSKATEVMWELKGLFDPSMLLNPGVVLNKDPKVHTHNLKPLPVANGIIDTCMECGFCESACPSGHVTLTPRQRIVGTREIARLEASGTVEDLNKMMEMKKDYDYLVLDTCAADGMCSVKCPVNINTGRMVKEIRASQTEADSVETKLINFSANNFGLLMGGLPAVLSLVDKIHGVFGSSVMDLGSRILAPVTGVHWNPYLPASAPALASQGPVSVPVGAERKKVVYFVTCVSRSMGGVARGDSDEGSSLHEKTMSVLSKAGYDVIIPNGISDHCCGLIFDSRGYPKQGATQMSSLEAELLEASENGALPILCDTSPCMARMKEEFKDTRLKKAIFEPTEFAATHLMSRLEIYRKEPSIAVHVPCSSKQMKKDGYFEEVARACSESVTMSPVACCGAAGDRGLRFPEISGGGDRSQVAVPPGAAMVIRDPSKGGNTTSNWTELKSSCTDGYSTSRTCEIQLSNATGTHFKSIMYLLDKCARPISATQ